MVFSVMYSNIVEYEVFWHMNLQSFQSDKNYRTSDSLSGIKTHTDTDRQTKGKRSERESKWKSLSEGSLGQTSKKHKQWRLKLWATESNSKVMHSIIHEM